MILLVAGFLVMTAVAAVEFVQLQVANDRIEELEDQVGGGGGDGDGLFGEIGDALEDLLGNLGEELGGLEGLPAADLLQCLEAGPPPQEAAPGGGVGGQVDAVARSVEQIRELRFEQPVRPTFLSADRTADRVRETFLSEYNPSLADREQRVLIALGAIPAGTDLRQLRAEALGREVIGFYDPETGELVVKSGGPELGAFERVTLAHELEHALADQRLGIPLPDDITAGSEDRDLAALAVVEGDATLTMQRYSTTLSPGEQIELIDPEAVAEAEASLAKLPHFLQRELLFPYEEGLNFVCRLYAAGGWESVNAAYDQPPESSDEILFPDRYVEGIAPVDPADPPGPGSGWRPAARYQLGAAHLLWLFEAPGGDPSRAVGDAQARVSAWAGGEIHLWTQGADSALSVIVAERSGKDDLCGSVQEWYGASFGDDTEDSAAGRVTFDGPDQDAVLACAPDEIRLGIGPDVRTAQSLTTAS
ncbi:MAG TPA: hypothetical protein VG602_00855 [Actinomycetota bacterium]|nr:hypothetical protein [Actinomycetota bacterium]